MRGMGVVAIKTAVADGLAFYNLSAANRSVKPAIFRFSTICLISTLLITAASSLLFLIDPHISTIYAQERLTAGIISNETEAVAPATFEFEADITGGTEPYTYLWNFGDDSEGSDERTVVHTFEEAGTYNVILAAIDTSNQNASDNMEISVGTVSPPLSVEIIPSRIVEVAPATFDFEANVIGGTEPYTYSWDFDGDETEDSNESSVSHTFDGAGIYDVALTVTDSNGLTASDEIAIIVVPSIGWVVVLVVLASIVIGGTALGKYKLNQRRRSRRIRIPPSAIVEITAKGGIDQ